MGFLQWLPVPSDVTAAGGHGLRTGLRIQFPHRVRTVTFPCGSRVSSLP